MGGVYLVYRALSDLRPVIQGRKWYWRFLVLIVGGIMNFLFVEKKNNNFRDEFVGILLQVAAERPNND